MQHGGDMKRRSKAVSIQYFSPRSLVAKVIVFSLVTGVACLLVIGRTKPELAASLRAQTADVVTPVVSFIQSPAKTMGSTYTSIRDFMHSRSEVQQLKLENQQLLKWQAEALKLKSENENLRELLRMVPAKSARYISAPIVSDPNGPYAQTALVGVGKQQGVKAQQAAIGTRGMVGYVIEAGDETARVLLLTDINSRVAVVGERSGKKAIAAGDGDGKLKLNYVSPSDHFMDGERLLTSGDGGFFPAGIPVARLADDGGETLLATPFASVADERVVSVLDYTF